MNFALPSILQALWLLPILIGLRLWADRGTRSAQSAVVAARLADQLVVRTPRLAQWGIFILQLIALGGFILALAQPRWGEERRIVNEGGKNVIIAIDTSNSMLVDDIAPNRITRAKLAAQDLVLSLKDQRVGLIAFAGSAYMNAPLTSDHSAVIEALDAIDTYSVGLGGSRIAEPITLALNAFAKTKARSHGLIVFSDGAEDAPELSDALTKAKLAGVRIISIGVGTDAGGLVPNPEQQGDFIRDPKTKTPVHSRIEKATLSKMAMATGGTFIQLGAQKVDAGVVLSALSSLETLESGAREEVKPIERFYWPLGIAILALMTSLLIRPRPKLGVVGLALMLLSVAPSSPAALLTEREAVEKAKEAYDTGSYQRAQDLYARLLNESVAPEHEGEFAYGLGAASAKAKDYERAAEAYSRALRTGGKPIQARAHHSLANSLYEQGAEAETTHREFATKAYVDALSHYESSLAIREDKAVRENMEFVAKKLEWVKQQQQQQKQKGQKGEKKEGQKSDEQQEGEEGEEGEPQDGEKKDGEKGEKGDKPGEPKDGEQGDEGDEKDGEPNGDKPGDKKGKGGKDTDILKEDDQGDQVPEGKISAGKPGDEKMSERDKEKARQQAMEDNKRNAETGYSPAEARNLLQAYSDQMTMQLNRNNKERPRDSRDW